MTYIWGDNMTIEKTTPYGCLHWHADENDFRSIRRITYQKDKLTYLVDSHYDIRCCQMDFKDAYDIALRYKAHFEYDKISNNDLKFMSDSLYQKVKPFDQSKTHKYPNITARNVYKDIEKCMNIHNFLEYNINFATLTTIEKIIDTINEYIAINGLTALNMERKIRDELMNEFYQLNDEMQNKIRNILFKDTHTYRDIDDIIKQISNLKQTL